jgi:branched-chain amino acid transport system ATP-binding protein
MGVFPGLTIDENIRIGGHLLSSEALRTRAEELYAIFPDLSQRRRSPASSLSGGQRKMLGIAKALAGKPRLLIMDEPSAGLAPLFVREVMRILAESRGEGLSLLVAEQNIKFLDLADRVYTLEGGRIGFSGTVPEIRSNDSVNRAYFGLK